MGVFEHFPYTNFHDLNLDWIVQELEKLTVDVRDFISINAIKYANPIQWDITSQYEKNTVVLDKDGNAYLSVQPVPAGVSLDRTEYWTNIGNFSALWESVKAAIAIPDEGHETVASEKREPNTLVWVNGQLLLCVRTVNAGDKYTTGKDGNSIVYTMQQLLTSLLEEVSNRETADTALEQVVTEKTKYAPKSFNSVQEIDTNNIKNGDKIVTLGFYAAFDGGGGVYGVSDSASDLSIPVGNLFIEPVFDEVVNVRQLGAYGDGTHDDSTVINKAIIYALANLKNVYFPSGKYLTTGIVMDQYEGISIFGDPENTYLLYDGSGWCVTLRSSGSANYPTRYTFKNINIIFKTAGAEGGFNTTRANECVFEHCGVWGSVWGEKNYPKKGWYCYDSVITKYINCVASRCTEIGFHHYGGMFVEHIYDNVFECNKSVLIEGGYKYNFVDCWYEAYNMAFNIQNSIEGVQMLNIDGCTFSQNNPDRANTNFLYADMRGTFDTKTTITVQNCRGYGKNIINAFYIVATDTCKPRVKIANSSFYDILERSIEIAGLPTVIFDNTVFENGKNTQGYGPIARTTPSAWPPIEFTSNSAVITVKAADWFDRKRYTGKIYGDATGNADFKIKDQTITSVTGKFMIEFSIVCRNNYEIMYAVTAHGTQSSTFVGTIANGKEDFTFGIPTGAEIWAEEIYT